jgi:hypothetical protein
MRRARGAAGCPEVRCFVAALLSSHTRNGCSALKDEEEAIETALSAVPPLDGPKEEEEEEVEELSDSDFDAEPFGPPPARCVLSVAPVPAPDIPNG